MHPSLACPGQLQVLPILVRGMPIPFLVTTSSVPAGQPLLRYVCGGWVVSPHASPGWT
jgi:hypothetical protein